MIADLIERARSIRRFQENDSVDMETLRSLVNLARFSPCAGNLQTLKYLLSAEPKTNRLIFPQLAWAGYLPDWPGPSAGERPAAYIVQLADLRLGQPKEVDAGIALQSMVIGAASLGLGSCIIGSVNRKKLQTVLSLPSDYSILYVLAIGRPAETVMVESIDSSGSIRYWRDEHGVHHVPKRILDELVVEP